MRRILPLLAFASLSGATLWSHPAPPLFELGNLAKVEGSALLNPERPAGDPIQLALPVGEGSYQVTIEVAAAPSADTYTVKSESRRLMVDRQTVAPGETAHFTFNVDVRTPALDDGGGVALNDREIGVWHWDDQLQLEIHGNPGRITHLTVEPLPPETTTLYIAGDSTVTDQPEEPWIGWGQMLPAFFGPEVLVANHAESGLALSTFRAHRRFEKILESIAPGDYLFIQFGHNDQKERGEGIGPWESYSDHLRFVIAEARKAGAHPVLITSMQRRRFDEANRQFSTLGDFPLAVRRVAAEQQVPLIDLNQMSATLYAALGPEDSKKAFVHYPAGTFPGQERALKDDTHFNPYGGYELARCIVEGIRLELPELAKKLRPGIPPFDPATPDSVESVDIPPSPGAAFTKPLGD